MNRDKIDNLIVYLMTISSYAKDIHYNCSGENFYGNHLFADRINENLSEYIDQIKEIILLGHGEKPLGSDVYLKRAALGIPKDISFGQMSELLLNALILIESIEGGSISKGDENLLGAIAQDLQNNIGLINIMYGDNK